MAEIVLSAFLTVLFEKLTSVAFVKLASDKGINSDIKKWQRSLFQIRDVLTDASQKEITDVSVKRWLNGLQHLAYDIDDILDDLATEAMHHDLSGHITSKVRKLIPTCCTSFSIGNRMQDNLNNITSKLQDLLDEKTTLGLIVKDGRSKSITRRLHTSLVHTSSIVGREADKKALLDKLLRDETCNENFSIVPIVGMGGIGKTTLARLLYDEKQVKDHFQLKAWVCVSDVFDSFDISKVIFQSVTGENKEFADLNLLQAALRDQLMGKQFLLVLDDVWSESFEDWESLVGPFLSTAPGSKIIMTTRKHQMLKKLGYNNPHYMQSLSHDDSMILFAQHALGENNFDSHPMLKPHGEGIVKKCDGLPLALRALGRSLRTKTNDQEWKELLYSEIWMLQEEDGIVPALRLSYHDLPAHLKQLFAYLALFPKGYVFDREDLILLWMAEGFLHQTIQWKLSERLGHEYFEELLARSFFQRVPNEESLFVMHDLMNDLATFVADDFFASLEKRVKNEALEKYRHMSFIREEYVVYEKLKAFQRAKGLRTFLAVYAGVEESWQRFYLSGKILADLLPELPLLRVLSLSCFEICEVPDFIGSLKHLRYLNLSRTQITHLPENVCNLYNLQTLILFGCRRLKRLPKSFLRLKHLRHFDIRDTPLLQKMPMGIGELKSLQTLSKIILGEHNGFAITELKDFENIHGKLSIKGLEKVQNAMQAHEASVPQKRLSELEVEWSDVFDSSRNGRLEKEVLNVLNPRKDNLKKLKIVAYGGKEFPTWVADPSFFCLSNVSLRRCRKCTTLPPFGHLPLLKELFIEGLDGVKVVGLELLGTSIAFPSLEHLRFKDMPGWEAWSISSGDVDALFPCLQMLHIENCPNLVDVSLDTLPSLRGLYIASCGHGVLSLTQAAVSVTQLDMWSISGLNDRLWRHIMENLTSLRMLDIRDCNNLESCICPNSIEMLRIVHCTSLTSVSFLTGGGQNLKSFVVNGCQAMDLGGENSTGVMRMLEGIYIRDWSNMKVITELSYFTHITRLVVRDCPRLESFPDQELPNLTSLKYLAILDCPSMDDLFPRGLWPPKLNYLRIGRLKKPISEWGPQNFPTSLARLELWGGPLEDVSNCAQLSHLLPPSLAYLFINEFEKLESLSVGLQHLTSLQNLFIYKCPEMRHLPEMLLPSLLSLTIYACPNLKERSSRKGSYYWPLISHIPCIDID
uniref:putative disease resistance protein At3g14460 n=1 Tax=Erigeron canadensis TaxID=72917 RepID=UPI001CB9CEA4|nr:putative disease resistance protein At3g14460 [Erigeron canadensis]